MRKDALTLALLQALAMSPAAIAAPAPEPAAAATADTVELTEVVVHGEITYRDRTDATAPTLGYDLEYFQRFEPLTVGDMLKRVPSVAFVSDMLEYDGVRLRGLDPGYTQVLINGKKVPGSGADRSFLVDRIPAELVDRIEIVRSASANRSGDAVAGAINIVLRDAYEFDGSYVRAGVLTFGDGEIKPTLGAVTSLKLGEGRLLLGANLQGRHNPKEKRSDRFDAPGGDFSDTELQDDVRDGTDYSANASFVTEFGASGKLSLDGVYVHTDRTETEHSLEYNDPAAFDRVHLLSDNDQFEEITQDNGSLSLGLSFDGLGGRNGIDVGWATFRDDTLNTEEETGYDDDESPPAFDGREGTRTLSETRDGELSVKLAHERKWGGATVEFGVDWQHKRREGELAVSEVESDVETGGLPAYADFERTDSVITERRVDPYVMVSGKADRLHWEAGLRHESTQSRVDADGDDTRNDYGVLLPSAHLRWSLANDDRVSLSLARTVRRPGFDMLLPVLLEGEFGDNDFIGNPELAPETAWGIDLGYEHRIGRRGIVGINVFQRRISDLIERVNTGAASDEAIGDFEDDVEEFLEENPGADETTPGFPQFDPDSFVYTVANVGEGRVWGIEFDLSTPLTALGLEHTGVFLNATWLDSDVADDLGRRRFNDQARSVLNVGFIQDLPAWGGAFGLSYRKQGDAYSRVLAEEVRTTYGADLEGFIVKRFGERLSVRLVGSNLLDASKDEQFHKFDTLGDQLDRDYDEYELETERSGRVFQLVARYAF
jgi:outer membrane receptor protein involved in Fe transport